MSSVPSRTATPNITSGSATTTSTVAGPTIRINGPILRLRAEPDGQTQTRRIQWAEDVVDNEGMGKKSSKVCCIYHGPKSAGDSSSDDSSSDSSSDSDSEPDLSRAQPSNRRAPRRIAHNHDHDQPCDHDHEHYQGTDDGDDVDGNRGSRKGKEKARQPSPNAYERVPQRKKGDT